MQSESSRWPFQDPPDKLILTMRQVMDGIEPIMHVCHDVDDEGWQFIGTSDPTLDNAICVCQSHMIEIDPTVAELADLPLGWHAWRDEVSGTWLRAPQPQEWIES